MASTACERWIDHLQHSSLFWPPPEELQQRKGQTTAYVEYFGQFTSEQFPDDVAELIQNNYPSHDKRLFDDVLAMFVLHHPEHGHAVMLPIISLVIDGTLFYDRCCPPFASFISLNYYSEQWALACGEILRILTHYNRPIFKVEHRSEADRSTSGKHATTSDSNDKECGAAAPGQQERKPIRPLSPWITDILLAAPLGVRSDYFRWCGGVMGKYAAGELKPPITASSQGSGKHPQLIPSTPRWAVANGAGVILSVCDEEVSRYDTATLTAIAVPALLLPPPTTALDEHLVAGLPALEPYARLFHRYYAIASPSATQRLLVGLLEAPPSWAPDALDAAVQLVELLRAAEEYASGMRLPRNWIHLHFLQAIGTAMSMRAGIAADAAAALLFRILSQPALLFPPLRQVEGVEVQHDSLGRQASSYRKQIEVVGTEASIDATAQGIASMLCANGPEVEWRICTIWEAAYGIIPLSSSAVDLPEIVVATPLQPPILSWNLYIPLLKVLEYLPRGSPSEACLMKIFVATVEAILRRTFPPEPSRESSRKMRYLYGLGSTSKNLAVAELRTMVHSLFLESCVSVDLASRLLFVVLTVCVSHEAQPNGSKKKRNEENISHDDAMDELPTVYAGQGENRRTVRAKKQGPVAAFDSYVVAAICALACELQLFPSIPKKKTCPQDDQDATKSVKHNVFSDAYQRSLDCAVRHTQRILAILEALFSLKPSSVGTSWSYSSNEIVAAAMVAAHVSDLFRRSKACMRSLSVLMHCKWDQEVYSRASSLYNLIDIYSKAVASIANKAEPLEAVLSHSPVWKGSCPSGGKNNNKRTKNGCTDLALELNRPCEDSAHSRSNKALKLNEKFSQEFSSIPSKASDLANFLTMDRHIGFSCSAQVLLRSLFAEKQEICFSVVSLLWYKLIAAPEMQLSAESTSAQQGWRQVVDALCHVVSALPAKAAAAIVLQAERELQPWTTSDDDQGHKTWRINQRIVKLIAELMRNHDTPESLVILASASNLLSCATDGMLVDGEACTLPQLELLEATTKAVQPILEWGESGFPIADGLLKLLKRRLPATIQCLSHPSAHVRALSISVVRDIMQIDVTESMALAEISSISGAPAEQSKSKLGIADWRSNIEMCLTWEAHNRISSEMTLEFLSIAAKELGCRFST
uniref:Gigantea n=1 Tax=Kalanchoe fedtschenkoi TaxID=63787 RepID=A0A7N0TN91_KALFE